jgi:Archaeal/vacuolar-type H+-ATPase subunit F
MYVAIYATDAMTLSSQFMYKQIAERIRNSVDSFTEAFPAILEIPSKDHPYDPEKDSVLRRVRRLFGE